MGGALLHPLGQLSPLRISPCLQARSPAPPPTKPDGGFGLRVHCAKRVDVGFVCLSMLGLRTHHSSWGMLCRHPFTHTQSKNLKALNPAYKFSIYACPALENQSQAKGFEQDRNCTNASSKSSCSRQSSESLEVLEGLDPRGGVQRLATIPRFEGAFFEAPSQS